MILIVALAVGFLFQTYDCDACADKRVLNGTCSEPTDVEQFTMADYSNALSAQSNSLYPGWSNSGKGLKQVPDEFKDIQKVILSGNFNCVAPKHSRSIKLEKKIFHHQLKHNINQLALCPWEFVKNIDTNRKPEVLLEAVCACKFPKTEHPDLFCENVYQHVTVFRKTGCDVGEYVYEKVSERIAVGCVTVAFPVDKMFLREEQYSRMEEK